MNGTAMNEAALLDLLGRIMITHAIDARHAMAVLGIDGAEATDLVNTGRLWAPLGVVRVKRLQLFVNILIRLEHRLAHDSGVIRLLLDTPWKNLGGAAPADLLGGSLDDLHRLRKAVETVEAPKVKWWRVGH